MEADANIEADASAWQGRQDELHAAAALAFAVGPDDAQGVGGFDDAVPEHSQVCHIGPSLENSIECGDGQGVIFR